MYFKNLLQNEIVRLRPIELSDLDLLYKWENDSAVWLVSGTTVPFSRELLTQYIRSADQDIYIVRQLRFIITKLDKPYIPVGAIDLFEFDPLNKRAGVGILIDPEYRKQGYAKEALSIMARYASERLLLRQLYSTITVNNTGSIRLFESAGYEICGTKKDWVATPDGWLDELMFQLFL